MMLNKIKKKKKKKKIYIYIYIYVQSKGKNGMNQIYCISHHRSLVRFSSRRSAEGKCKFSQVNDLVACFWFIFGSRPEVLELARSLNSYFLECYIWSCGFYQDVFMGHWRLNFPLVFLKSFVRVRLVFLSSPALEY